VPGGLQSNLQKLSDSGVCPRQEMAEGVRSAELVETKFCRSLIY
jgi:hypothetical protein